MECKKCKSITCRICDWHISYNDKRSRKNGYWCGKINEYVKKPCQYLEYVGDDYLNNLIYHIDKLYNVYYKIEELINKVIT
jgi:hypothetical protein